MITALCNVIVSTNKYLIKHMQCGIVNKKEVKYMSVDKAIKNAVASIEMEGFEVDEQSVEWCRMLLNNEITMEQYISLVKKSAGVA